MTGFAFGQTVTIVRADPGTLDDYGRTVTSTVTRTDVDGCAVAPRYSSEPVERGRQGVIVGLTLYAPAGTCIEFTDTVEICGVAYRVDGIPAEWVNPYTGWQPGIEVALRRAEG